MNDLVVLAGGWFLVLIVFLSFLTLRRYMEHRERMAMILRGITPPEKRPNTLSPRPRLARRTGVLQGGLITAMVGLALTIGLYPIGFLVPASLTTPDRLGPWLLAGLIPLAVGIALILGHYLTPGRPVDLANGGSGALPSEPVSRAQPSSSSASPEEQAASAEPGAFPERGRWMFYRRESSADTQAGSDDASERKANP